MEYNIYCLSNASTDIFRNVLTSFQNLFPNSLNIIDDKFEIGLVSVGIHLNYDSSPGLFQVRSNIISDVPNGNDYSTILFSSSLPNKFKKQYYYHHVNRINYYPVRHTNISTISVKLTDVLGNQLPIKEGQPSIVHFHLKEKEKNMDHDITYVRLDSKVDAKLDYENTNNSFWTHLKHPIYLNGNATMALSDISYPNAVKPITKLENKRRQKLYFKFKQKVSSFEKRYYTIVVPDIICNDEFSLMQKLNETLPEIAKTKIKFTIDNGYFVFKNKSSQPVVISLPNYIAKYLGLTNDTDNLHYEYDLSDGNTEFVSKNKMNSCEPIPKVIENKLKQKIHFIVKKEKISPRDDNYRMYSQIVSDIICHDEIEIMKKLNEELPEPMKTKIQFKIKDRHFTIVNKSDKPIVVILPKYLSDFLGFTDEQLVEFFNVQLAPNELNIGVDANSEFVSQNEMEDCKKIPEIVENKEKEKIYLT